MKSILKSKLLPFMAAVTLVFSVFVPVTFAEPYKGELHKAILNRATPKERIEQMLAEHPDWRDQYDKDNLCPIHFAAGVCRTDILEVLVSRGANVNQPGPRGNMPVLYALIADKPISEIEPTVDWLCSHGAQVSPTLLFDLIDGRKFKDTILWFCKKFSIDLNGVYTSDKYADGKRSALMEAMSYGGHPPFALADAFLDMGADVRYVSKGGCQVLHYYSGGFERYREEDCKAFLIKLLGKGADINCRDNNGNTPLHYAAKNCRYEGVNAIKYLLENGADPTIKNNEGQTPEDIATERRNNHASGGREAWSLLHRTGGGSSETGLKDLANGCCTLL